MSFTNLLNSPPSRFHRNDCVLLPVEPLKIDAVTSPHFFFVRLVPPSRDSDHTLMQVCNKFDTARLA